MNSPSSSVPPMITQNPTLAGWDQQEHRTKLARAESERVGTDTAIRAGLASAYPARRGKPEDSQVAAPTPPPQAAGPSSGSALPSVPPASAAPATPQERPNPLGAVVSNLAMTPGGGARGLATAIQDQNMGLSRDRLTQQGTLQHQRQQQQSERFVLTALAQGQSEMAQHFAQQAGITLPPQVLQNAQMGKLVGTGTLIAQRLYGNDKQGAMRFTRAYMTNGGNADAAAQAAGAPNPQLASSGTNWQPVDVQTATGAVRGYTDRTNPGGTVQFPQMPGGGQVPLAKGGAAGGATTRAQVMYQMLTEHGGLSPADAARVVGGIAVKPATIATAYTTFQKAIINNPLIPKGQRAEKLEEAMSVFGPNWRQMIGAGAAATGAPGGALGGLNATPPPAAPAAPTAAPPTTPAPAAAPRFTPGQTLRQGGKTYRVDANGVPQEVAQ